MSWNIMTQCGSNETADITKHSVINLLYKGKQSGSQSRGHIWWIYAAFVLQFGSSFLNIVQ